MIRRLLKLLGVIKDPVPEPVPVAVAERSVVVVRSTPIAGGYQTKVRDAETGKPYFRFTHSRFTVGAIHPLKDVN